MAVSTNPPPPSSHPRTWPFLSPSPKSSPSALSILHLRRDHHIPVVLQSSSAPSDGYVEGPVVNTRFGSFPHSTLVNRPWGAQIRASEVDTGSRGRKGWEGKGKKRKRGQDVEAVEDAHDVGVDEEIAKKAIKTAATGFVHLLPPTPELWTSSLPHRTQVVYTPDYSYILHRIRARPGSVIIEAGAGSGSFTHAAARAVFNGYPDPVKERVGTQTNDTSGATEVKKPHVEKRGRVYSFEFHKPRCNALRSEIADHGLDGIVELTHRDVCSEGFNPNSEQPIHADAIFLDLPAPWLALKHLTRKIRRKAFPTLQQQSSDDTNRPTSSPPSPTIPADMPNPALHPSLPIHICTFSPCIEQVTRTVSTLRTLGWLDISMVELSAKKIETRRERVGLQEEGLRGVNPSPKNVEEAVERLREVEGRTRWFQEQEVRKEHNAKKAEQEEREEQALNEAEAKGGEKEKYASKQARLATIASLLPTRKLYKEGRLVHKPEPELKLHTSYLVFAVLPREWSEEDEALAQEMWGGTVDEVGEKGKEKELSKRQKRKEAKRRKEERIGAGDQTVDKVVDQVVDGVADAPVNNRSDERTDGMANETATKLASVMADEMAEEMADQTADELAHERADETAKMLDNSMANEQAKRTESKIP